MSRLADLHIHTYYSDSTSSPEEVVEQAHSANISCIAISDHDTVDGIAPTIEAAKQYDIEVIPGIELSSEWQGRDIHVLGYLFDYTDKEFIARLSDMQDSRIARMQEMIEKIKELGMDGITLDEVCAMTESKSVGRPHLAAKMLERGYVTSIRQAFDKYLADDMPAYVPKLKISPENAIAMIHKAGGLAVLAHPMMTKVDELIPGFVKAGLDGMEVYYPNVASNLITFYENIAKKHNLLRTGGSDAHGSAKRHTYIGKQTIPYELVEELKSAAVKK